MILRLTDKYGDDLAVDSDIIKAVWTDHSSFPDGSGEVKVVHGSTIVIEGGRDLFVKENVGEI